MKKRRHTKRKERKATKEKDGRKRKGRANILLDEGGDDPLSDVGSDSESSVSLLNSIAHSDSIIGDSKGSGNGRGNSGSSGSDSDSVRCTVGHHNSFVVDSIWSQFPLWAGGRGGREW